MGIKNKKKCVGLLKTLLLSQFTESERLELRALEPEDLDLIYQWENDTQVWEISNTIFPYSKYILRKYLDNAHLDIFHIKQQRLMIDLKSNHDPVSIGTIDLFDFEPFHNRIGIGILIKEKKYRGKGYAKEALNLTVNYLFQILNVHQVYCNITKDNEISLNLFQSIGFEIAGEKKDWLKTTKGWKNEYLLQLINKNN